jgi:hypothetical protein
MKTFAWLLAAAVLAAAAPASATSFVLNLSGGGTNVGGTSNGNVRSYSSTIGSDTLTLQASGWTNAVDLNPDTLLKSYLGAYSGGLGVTSPPETGSNNTHTIDNVGREDFVLLKFNKAVDLTSMFLNVFTVGAGPDSDATVFYKNGATAPANNGLSNTYFAQFASISVPGGSTSGARVVDVGGNYADTWLVSAKVAQGASANDGFKLYSINVTTRAVPEPATWAMMLIGFGAAGAAMRARRRVAVAS